MKYGVDLSAWQENVNWQGLISAGYEFAIIKLGENYQLTETFVQQINEATQNGLKVGVYFYSHALSKEQAKQEAQWVSDQIINYLGSCPEMGIWFDFEDPPIIENAVDNLTDICLAFVEKVKENGLDYVGVYTSYSWFTNYLELLKLGDVPLWTAQYNSQDDLKLENPTANIKLWQFTNKVSEELPYDGSILYD